MRFSRVTRRVRAPAGFTLIEMMIAVVLIAILLGATLGVILRSQLLFTAQAQQFDLADTALRIMSRMTQELRGADPDTVMPLVLADSTTIQYQKVTGYGGGAVQLGPASTVSFGLVPTETLNGQDDNGDGRIDEGRVILTIDPAPPLVIAEDVLSLRMNSIAKGVAITLTVGKVDREQQVIQSTHTRELTFRN